MTDLTALAYTTEHEWISLDGDPSTGSGQVLATVGITDYAADQLGDVVYVELPAVESAVTAGQICGEIESTKSVGELFAPLTGDIVAVNDAVEGDPSLLNSSPFEHGWLIKIRVDGPLPEGLLDRAAYVALTGRAA